MSRVISYTPSWLSRPSPGARIFSDPEQQLSASPVRKTGSAQSQNTPTSTQPTTSRTIASRGTEIFTVVGNRIRWADLSRVQEDWEDQSSGRRRQEEKEAYRSLLVPVFYQIKQIAISPSGNFLSICTDHTIYIAVLPDYSRLADSSTPLKLKTYHLGPTIHVIPEPPLVSALWHPLAASNNSTDCLVTVTSESVVRLWEINVADNWSFERPSLAIDLRKLADGVSSDQDFEPSGFGKSRGFSADAFDMEAAAACFGGKGKPDEDGWASMTLWTAMSNGDVYALCPLLPSRWRLSGSTVPALSISTVSKMATLESQTSDEDERKAVIQQYEWVQEIDNDDYIVDNTDSSEIRIRPQNPSAIPRLQGPFELTQPEEFDDNVATDIHVIAARLDEETILSGEEDYDIGSTGLQFTTVCLGSTSGQVIVTIELEGVSGQWLPKKGRSTFSVPMSEARDLIQLDKVMISQPTPGSSVWPAISADAHDDYQFYATGSKHIKCVSLSDWACRVGGELDGEDAGVAGLQTRLSVLCQSSICVTRDLYTAENQSAAPAVPLAVPVQVIDADIGNLLLSSLGGQACAVLLDDHQSDIILSSSLGNSILSASRGPGAFAQSTSQRVPDPIPTRAPYAPAGIFYQNQLQSTNDLRQNIPPGRKFVLNETPVRLSPACLDIMTMAHRSFSAQTSNIEKAAAELFRNCERLREEIADQVKQMCELADRLQHIRQDSTSSSDGNRGTFVERLATAQEKQKRLFQRYEALRRKSGRTATSNQKLSNKEQVWIGEIETLASNVGMKDDQNGHETTPSTASTLRDRYEVVQSHVKDLVAQSKQYSDMTSPLKKEEDPRNITSPSRRADLPSRLQRERVAEVMAMVERESAVIDAVMSRLNKLNVG